MVMTYWLFFLIFLFLFFFFLRAKGDGLSEGFRERFPFYDEQRRASGRGVRQREKIAVTICCSVCRLLSIFRLLSLSPSLPLNEVGPLFLLFLLFLVVILSSSFCFCLPFFFAPYPPRSSC